MIKFRSKPKSVDELFEFISGSKFANSVLQEFMPLYRSGEIQIRSMEDIPDTEDVSVVAHQSTLEAAFYYDGKSKVIYVDMDQPMGVLAPMVFHEIVHSLDHDYHATYKRNVELYKEHHEGGNAILSRASLRTRIPRKNLTEGDLDNREITDFIDLRERFEAHDQRRTFLAERKAFQSQHKLMSDLCKSVDGYLDYVDSDEFLRDMLLQCQTDEEILETYGLEPKHVMDYLGKSTTTVPKKD